MTLLKTREGLPDQVLSGGCFWPVVKQYKAGRVRMLIAEEEGQYVVYKDKSTVNDTATMFVPTFYISEATRKALSELGPPKVTRNSN